MTAYSMNVDFEVPNTPGSAADCQEHRSAGTHYDITIHRPGCRHHHGKRAGRARRYWRDFDSEAKARDFATGIAARPGITLPHRPLVRFCRD